MSDATQGQSGSTIGKWALALAGLLALGAVGTAVWRSQQTDAPASAVPAAGETPVPVAEMITRLETRLKEKPDDAEGWRMLGWSYFETGRFAEAATALKRATTLDPKNAELYSMLGEALVMASEGEGMPVDARAAFDTALRLDPKDARARYFNAVALDLDGKHAEAIDGWFALLADTPADAPYAQDIREVITAVGKEHGIDVATRLASSQFAPPAGGLKTDGAEVATAGIPGPNREQMQAASQLPQGQQEAMVRGMVDGLDARLRKNPNDANGWIMLMRSRVQLGERQKAAKALTDGLAAFRNDTEASRRLREAASALGIQAAG